MVTNEIYKILCYLHFKVDKKKLYNINKTTKNGKHKSLYKKP